MTEEQPLGTHARRGARAAGIEPPRSVVWLAGPEHDARDRIQVALAALPGAPEIVAIDDSERAPSPEPADEPTLCCYAAPAADAATSGLEHDLTRLTARAGSAPVVFAGPAADAAAAFAAGAWDAFETANTETLAARLARAYAVGRERAQGQSLAARLNRTERELDAALSAGQAARGSIRARRIVAANPAFAELLGADDPATVSGQNLIDWVRPTDREAIDAALREENAVEPRRLRFTVEPVGKHPRALEATLTPTADDADAFDIGLRPVDGPQAVHRERAHSAAVDGRSALHRALARAPATDAEITGLIFVAVDEIDALQDDHGMAGADALLLDAALFVLDTVEAADRCFRFAAGEIVVVAERASRDTLTETARHLHAAFANANFGGGDDDAPAASLHASVASTVLIGEAGDRDAQLKRVMDEAYAVRAAGGNAYRDCAQTRREDIAATEADDWALRLREALAQNRFSLAYQGITSLAGDSQPYFDVLVRYVDDGGALVRPGLFLAAAEQTGLMPEIDRWVTRRAAEVIAQQAAQSRHLSLFVKISAATIAASGDFLNWLQDAIPDDDPARPGVIFCMREQDARSQSRAARTLAAELQARQFRIALTHFGGSARAAQMLDDLPAAFVKLSPDFAKQLAAGSDDRLVDIVSATRARQIPLIAEQIEDANSMARLWQAGVNYVQGHFIQEPDTEALARGDNRML